MWPGVSRPRRNLPAHRWQTQRRVKHAEAMLLSPWVSSTEVALESSFASSAHFATMFRNQVNVSPSVWRQERQS
ncbi:helix-turn-helix domain-containing protein [Bosea eneae]|uniref:Helix-turn-helix domain-containing protein n=1 Tax=Bosea eneae TaxID=151454 RepID=A0ABW0IZ43_9HYPH